MCGLAGIVDLRGEPIAHETLKRMTDAIAHRGPDGEGHWTDGPVGLGHRRLAIIDLSPGGAPADGDPGPATSPSSTTARSTTSRSSAPSCRRSDTGSARSSDTEVLLHAYARVGRRAASSGSTACSRSRVWERRTPARCCWPATATASSRCTTGATATPLRVRLGDQGAASPHPACPARVACQRCTSTSPSRTSSPTRPCSRACGCCLPGHRGRRRDGASSRTGAVLGLPFGIDTLGDRARTSAWTSCSAAFAARPCRQLVSDVPVGSYLSGGMDSGSITAIAVEHLGRIHTFTARVRPHLGVRHRARLRRAAAGGDDGPPVQDRALRGRAARG